MTHWKQLTPREQKLAESVFVALRNLEVSEEVPEATPRTSFAELYRCVSQAETVFSPSLALSLKKNRKLRDAFRRLLEKSAHYHFPRAAAASTGPITLREIEGFRIRLRPSHVEPDQVYVIIELPEDVSFIPRSLFIYHASSACLKYSLPDPINGTIQLLTENESELAAGIRDHKSEIFLR